MKESIEGLEVPQISFKKSTMKSILEKYILFKDHLAERSLIWKYLLTLRIFIVFFRVFNRDRLREKRDKYEDTIVNDVLYDYKFNLIKFVYDISKVDSIE